MSTPLSPILPPLKPIKRAIHRLIIAIFISCLLISGCSTIVTHSDDTIIPGPYIGTKRAVEQTKRHWYNYDYYGQVFLYAMDVPMCVIADTVVLPYDLYRSYNR